MNKKTDNQEDDSVSREQIRDAIALLSSIGLHLDGAEPSSAGMTSNLRKKTPDHDGGDAFFSKKNWRSFLPDMAANLVPAALAIAVGWYLIEQTYLSERQAAAPVLGVEYAYFSEIGSVEKRPISKLIHQIAQFELYREFMIKNMGRHDIRHIDAMADEIGAGDADKLAQSVSMYREFLSEKENELSQRVNAIPAMSKSELRMQGRAALESISGLDEDRIRAELVGKLRNNQDEIDRLFVVLDSVGRLLRRVGNRVFVKLSILNTGGRAGLVRPRGYIEYLDVCHTMVRADAPPQDEQPIAVPTYVVNSDTSAVTQTVGKIDSDTMAQYWFEVRKPVKGVTSCEGLRETLEKEATAGDRQPKICADGEKAVAYLFDHKNNVMADEVACSGPIL